MLFKFGKSWKALLFTLFVWGSFALCGFEFTVVTILALIFTQNFKDEHSLL